MSLKSRVHEMSGGAIRAAKTGDVVRIQGRGASVWVIETGGTISANSTEIHVGTRV